VKILRTMAWVLGFAMVLFPVAGLAERVPDQLIQQMVHDNQNMKVCLSKIGLAELTKHLEARRVSLSRRGDSEYIVEATGNPDGCGLCGNRRCDKWIYGQTGGSYRMLLYVGGADDVVILGSTTRGYRNLKVIYPAGNNYPAFYEIYAFEGRQYKKKGGPMDIR
jgi:hypothetical protein